MCVSETTVDLMMTPAAQASADMYAVLMHSEAELVVLTDFAQTRTPLDLASDVLTAAVQAA